MNVTVVPDCPECQGSGGRWDDCPLDAFDDWLPCKTCRKRYQDLLRKQQTVGIEYRNHRGEVAWRTIVPIAIEYKATEWHPQKQWLLRAWDVDKGAERDFAMADILEWGKTP